MTGLRYSPLHVTEFCGEMQGKFKVGLARLTRRSKIVGRARREDMLLLVLTSYLFVRDPRLWAWHIFFLSP